MIPQYSPPKIDLGALLKKIRKGKGMTMDDLARASGVSKSMLSQIEAKKTNPTLATLGKVAQGLGLSIQHILDLGLPNPPNQTSHTFTRSSDRVALEVNKPGVHFSVLTPLSTAGDLEVYTLEIAPGTTLESFAHLPGTREALTLISGSL